MSIRNLRQVLDRVEPEREIWLSPGGLTVRAAEIKQLVIGSKGFLDRFRGKNVAVFARSESELAPLLVLLDGTCAQVMLLPTARPPDQLAQIVIRSGADMLVTTDPEAVTSSPFAVCPVDVDGLWRQSGKDEKPDDAPLLSTRWVLASSGTTGEPKLVAHTLASLTRTVKHDLAKGKFFRWGALYNLTGFAGLQVFLQSWCGGSPLILRKPDASLQEQVADLVSAGCSALSATPTMWRKLLMAYSIDRLPLKQITLGGEIVDGKILAALRRAFPTANIVHIYASTEAGVGFAVRDGLAGFPASFLNDPPRGIQVAVDAEGKLLLRSDCDEQQYLDDRTPLKRDDGFIDTGDLVRKEGDRFLFLGRANGTINVGGNKVHPEEVERFLADCEGVQLARVTGRSNPFTGSLVNAEIVPEASYKSNADRLREQVLARCRAELEPYKVPAVVRIVEAIELTVSGKVKRMDS